jgi:hypothetical protein
MAEETIILMRTNIMEVSLKTGMPYEELERRYEKAKLKNNIVILTIDNSGRLSFND